MPVKVTVAGRGKWLKGCSPLHTKMYYLYPGAPTHSLHLVNIFEVSSSICGLGGERDLRGKKRGPAVTRIIERVKAHYEVHEVELGVVYRWCPESVVVGCKCGEK